jgi:hypothetical protein
MTQWEYRFISLWRAAPKYESTSAPEFMREHRPDLFPPEPPSAFEVFAAEVAEAGLEGWEAVGPVSISWSPHGPGYPSTSNSTLLFKRPLGVTSGA